jgi:hypothetical protein
MARNEIGAIGIILIIIMAALPAVSASDDSLSDLRSLTSGFDDPLINSEDLAFYLVTHDFDATPKGEYVEVDLAGSIYKLTPNGSAHGLCSIES